MASLTQWTWAWANSGRLWQTGKLACCSSRGHKESDTTDNNLKGGLEQGRFTSFYCLPLSFPTCHQSNLCVFNWLFQRVKNSAHGTFSRIDHILGHKSKLDKFKKIEIIPSIFSDHNALRLDLNYRRKTIKNSNIWRLNNTLLNNQQITEEIKKEIKICIETNESESTTTQNLWDTVKAVLRGRFIAIQAYLKKQEKSQKSNNSTPKATWKGRNYAPGLVEGKKS